MTIAIRLSGRIAEAAQIMSKIFNRSVSGQIKYWAEIGKLVEDNPDLSYELIKDILIAKEELKNEEAEPYHFLK